MFSGGEGAGEVEAERRVVRWGSGVQDLVGGHLSRER